MNFIFKPIFSSFYLLVFLFLFIDNISCQNAEVYNLRKLNVNSSLITLSGFSAGSSMATQLHMAHSSLFSGVALFSQVFYRCGPGSLIEFGIRCSKNGYGLFPYNVRRAIEDAKSYAESGLIDSLNNLEDNRVFIWIGNQDEFIPLNLAAQNKRFYEAFVKNSTENIKLIVENAKHLFPTKNFGGGCLENAEHNYYLGNCNFSGAAHAFGHLYKGLIDIQPISLVAGFDIGRLRIFNQSEFYYEDHRSFINTGFRKNISKIGMGSVGHIYIPRSCGNDDSQCYLHFNFYGCNEWQVDVARNYILNSGFLPLAESLNIIIVFPLTTSIPSNYNGCWDFFSYTGRCFATNKGEQIKVVHRMIQRILTGN